MEENMINNEDDAIIKLEVKLLGKDELLILKGTNYFFQVESIQTQIANKQDIICFGYLGVKRELIEWFSFDEIKEASCGINAGGTGIDIKKISEQLCKEMRNQKPIMSY